MARWLIILGVVLIVAGLLWPWLGKFGLGRLPGDIVIERENFRLYLPLKPARVACGARQSLLPGSKVYSSCGRRTPRSA